MLQDLNSVIDLVLADADAAHRQHLTTTSFAEHVALGEFYTQVRKDMDAFAEALIAMGQKPGAGSSALDQLKASFAQLNDLRSVCDGVAAAENLFDNIGATYLSAIYKLERLK
jgi:DNA-binding ferritin-like protein